MQFSAVIPGSRVEGAVSWRRHPDGVPSGLSQTPNFNFSQNVLSMANEATKATSVLTTREGLEQKAVTFCDTQYCN